MTLDHSTEDSLIQWRGEKAGQACKQLGLDEKKYRGTFEQIADTWERQLGAVAYLETFLTPCILKICREPADFLRASQIVIQAAKEVFGDGSNGFFQALVQAITEGKVTSLNGLQILCDQLVVRNLDFRRSEAGSNPLQRTGQQFQRFLAEINPQL